MFIDGKFPGRGRDDNAEEKIDICEKNILKQEISHMVQYETGDIGLSQWCGQYIQSKSKENNVCGGYSWTHTSV